MTPTVLLCPFCGSPCVTLVRTGALGKTCGKRACRGKSAAKTVGPEHYQRIAKLAGRPRKPRIRTEDYVAGYDAGHATGRVSGFKDGYAAAKADRANG